MSEKNLLHEQTISDAVKGKSQQRKTIKMRRRRKKNA